MILKKVDSLYVEERRQLRVQIEWTDSLLLFQAHYHLYDDVARIHNYQMRREISALQAENYSLERQLFSYQRSIALAHSRGQYSEDTDEIGDFRYRDEAHDRPPYSLADRSVSTDTEYA
ncbi:unnamed protein product [Darwinula stevensoni]|uniref:Uncharacterized protein n=1 Tax=Darwinula stevensoni TaxID=69355 RepID=A0A7R9FQ35_9CRUS|nr:unnamed protein product [Darwinula stevensoni]CAG0898728.1 unnamed protein product [Darwinula stevensoni]